MKKHIRLYILALITLFCSCSEDKGNYDYKLVNELAVTGLPKDTAVMHAEVLKLQPVFERSLQLTEDGLEYSWILAGEVIATTRDLNYTIPANLNVGKYDCRYVVTDTKNGMKYFKDLNINIVSTFSWGYYFLCEEPDQSTVLSYFSTKEGNTQCLHATKVGDYSFGKQPKTIIEKFGNISALNDYYYTFTIITSQGENPVIMTNNGSFMPAGLVNNSSFMFEGEAEFHPTDALIMQNQDGDIHFISGGKIYSYNEGLLYRAAKHEKDYFWSNPIGFYGYAFVFDELSKKYYVVKNQIDDPVLGLVRDAYALDRVIEVKNQPSYAGQTFLCKELNSSLGLFCLATVEPGKVHLITYEYIDNQPEKDDQPAINEEGHVTEMNTLSLASADEHTQGVLVADNDWYFVAGNKVYTSPVLKPVIADFVTLPDDMGTPVAVAVSSKETQLIIATYDANSPKEYKGSFAIVDLMSKEVTVHRNVMGKCVVAKGYDANPWF